MASEWRETVYGRFPMHFAEDRLANLCDHIDGVQTGPFGSQLHQRDYVPVGTPIITVEHLGENRIIRKDFPHVSDDDSNRLSKYTLRKGDIVFSRVGSVDRRSLVRQTEEGWLFSGRCLRVRPNPDKIDPGYLSYFFGMETFQEHIRSVAVGATMPSLNTQILSNVAVFYPPLPVQRSIADVLGALDDKIEQNRQTAGKLERLAQAIFRAWFVDFEPVKAKAAGADSFASMPQNVVDALPTRFIDSEIGPVPEGWEVKALSTICTLVSGGTPKRSDPSYWSGDVPWYSVKDAPREGETWVINTDETITQDGLAESAARLVPKGCTIISARGTVGKLAMAGMPMAFNQSCYGLWPSDGISFRHLYLLVHTAVAALQQKTHGSVFDTITRTTFDGLIVISPPSNVLSAFEERVAPFFDASFASLQESVKLV